MDIECDSSNRVSPYYWSTHIIATVSKAEELFADLEVRSTLYKM